MHRKIHDAGVVQLERWGGLLHRLCALPCALVQGFLLYFLLFAQKCLLLEVNRTKLVHRCKEALQKEEAKQCLDLHQAKHCL